MKRTPLIVFILLIVAGMYDMGMVVFSGVPSSISQFIVNTTHVSPLMAFVWGTVIGHLFFGMAPKLEGK